MTNAGSRWLQLTSRRVLDEIPTPVRMVIFFASNPEIEMTAKEIAFKWGLTRPDARRVGRKLAEQGYLQAEHKPSWAPQDSAHYRAGPVIRAELGYSDEFDERAQA